MSNTARAVVLGGLGVKVASSSVSATLTSQILPLRLAVAMVLKMRRSRPPLRTGTRSILCRKDHLQRTKCHNDVTCRAFGVLPVQRPAPSEPTAKAVVAVVVRAFAQLKRAEYVAG